MQLFVSLFLNYVLKTTVLPTKPFTVILCDSIRINCFIQAFDLNFYLFIKEAKIVNVPLARVEDGILPLPWL